MKLIEIKDGIALLELKDYYYSETGEPIKIQMNGETLVKIDELKVKNHHQYYVKEQYLKDYPEYDKLSGLDIWKNTDIQKYLHRVDGPALIDVKNDMKNYFIEGQQYTKEETND